MTFSEKKVEHRLWGTGTINDCCDGKIMISFDSGEKTLQYPEAFTLNYLVTEDQDILDDVNQVIMARIQAEAERRNVNTHSNNPDYAALPSYITNTDRRNYTYRDWENEFPEFVIIQLEGFMYSVHNKSAEVLNQILDYELYTDNYGRISTGGPDEVVITDALEANSYSYIVIQYRNIIDSKVGINAFTALNL